MGTPLRNRKSWRRGTTAVEFALTAPLVFFLGLTGYEFCRVHMMQHTMDNAAYEGCRRGIVHGARASDARDAAQQILNIGFIAGTTIDVIPNVITPQTEVITVNITAPVDTNSWVPPFFFQGRIVESSCTLSREQFETIGM